VPLPSARAERSDRFEHCPESLASQPQRVCLHPTPFAVSVAPANRGGEEEGGEEGGREGGDTDAHAHTQSVSRVRTLNESWEYRILHEIPSTFT